MAESNGTGKVRKLDSACLRERLKLHFENIKRTCPQSLYYQFKFCFVKLKDFNAAYPVSFSEAWCQSERNLEIDDERLQKVVGFDDVFNVEIIENFIYQRSNSVSKPLTRCFENLASFLDNITETNTIFQKHVRKEEMSEVEWAGVVGIHILGKLSQAKHMIVSDFECATRTSNCPCGCRTPITYGDTSMGNNEVWHGCVDIILGSAIAVHVLSDNDEDCQDNSSAVEIKKRNMEDCRNQLIAETVVFSHLQKSGLVPSVVISKEKVKVFMYDPEHDLLYESTEVSLFQKKYVKGTTKQEEKLNVFAVLALWHVLNYSLFCTGVKSSHLNVGFFADFKKIMKKKNDKVLEVYEKQMCFGGCKPGKRSLDKFTLVEPSYAYSEIEHTSTS